MQIVTSTKKFLKKPDNALVLLTILSVILSLSIGLVLRSVTSVTYRQAKLVGFPGELMMNMFKMLIIPLVISSLITALSDLDVKTTGRICLYTIAYFIITTLLAVILGIILVVSIHPGTKTIKDQLGEGDMTKTIHINTLDAFLDMLRNIFPSNLVEMCFQQVATGTKVVKKYYYENSTKMYTNETQFIIIKKEGTNVLGLLSFSIVFGLILRKLGMEAQIMIEFFSILNRVVMKLVMMIMWYSPIGIFFLITGKILEIDDLLVTASSLGFYMLTVLIGLIIHGGIILNLIYFLFTKRNPFKFFYGMLQAFITALGTASSSATLPITIKCLEENLGVDKRVTRFILPLGVTVNMDGTALYEAVAAIFIAQMNEINLNFGQIVTISITATLAAVSAAAVPSAGLVTLLLVLSSIGVPTNDVSLIFTVDWLLDRLRTSINVYGDALGAGIIDHLCKIHLKIEPENENVRKATNESV